MKLPFNLRKNKGIQNYLSKMLLNVLVIGSLCNSMAIFGLSMVAVKNKINSNMAVGSNSLTSLSEQNYKNIEEHLRLMAMNDGLLKGIRDLNNHKGSIVGDATDVDSKYVESTQTQLKDLVKNNPAIVRAYIGTNANKFQSYPVRKESAYKCTKEEWYSNAYNSKDAVWSNLYTDKDLDRAIITISVPVTNNEKVIGVIGVDVDFEQIASQYKELSPSDKAFFAYLIPEQTEKGLEYKIVYNSNEETAKLLSNKYITESQDNPSEGYVKADKLIEKIEKSSDSLTDEDDMEVIEIDNVKYYARVRKDEKIQAYKLMTVTCQQYNSIAIGILTNSLVLNILPNMLGLYVINKVSKKLGNQIGEVSDTLNKISEGDLSSEIESDLVNVELETGELARNLNASCKALRLLLEEISEAGETLSVSANEVTSSAQETNSRIEEISATMENISLGIAEQASYSENSKEVIESLANKLNELNVLSEYIYKKTSEIEEENSLGMESIKELKYYTEQNNISSNEVANNINELNLKTDSIGVIVETMTSIAEQTNLLALNASIEAARVNDPGFLVLAGEVKKLSDQSAKQAEIIRGIIKEIQKNVDSSVVGMEKSVNINKEQTRAVQLVVEAFENIANSTKIASKSISEVNDFISVINKDKDIMVDTIDKIVKVSNNSAMSTEEISASIEEQSALTQDLTNTADGLNTLSEELMQNVSKFNL